MTHQPGSISNQRCDSRADVGAAWWLLCSPSPAVIERQPLQVAGAVGIRPAAEVVGDGVHRGRPAEIQVDVDERGEQADDRAEHDDEDARRRWPARTGRGRRTSGRPGSAAGPWRSGRASPGCAPRGGTGRRCCICTLHQPSSTGECGSPSTSVKAWCLRCTATHWRGRIPVVIHTRKRKTSVTGR